MTKIIGPDFTLGVMESLDFILGVIGPDFLALCGLENGALLCFTG